MLNRVVLVGRLTKDPELRMTPSNVAVATFTIAVNRTFANAQGEREADFIQVVVWRKQAENVSQYVRKGSQVGVDGRLQTRNYEGQDGRRVYVTEVVAESVQFLEPKGSSGSSNYGDNNYQSAPVSSGPAISSGQSTSSNNEINFEDDPFANNGQKIDILEDDLPF